MLFDWNFMRVKKYELSMKKFCNQINWIYKIQNVQYVFYDLKMSS